MKLTALATLLATVSGQTPDYLLGRWRGLNVKYGEPGNMGLGEFGIVFDDWTMKTLDHNNQPHMEFDVLQEGDKIFLHDRNNKFYKFEIKMNELKGVNLHTISAYSLVMPSDKEPYPGGPKGVQIPDTLEEALLDNTSTVNIVLKCRADVHDKQCDFSSIKPLSQDNFINNGELIDFNDDELDDQSEFESVIQRQLIVSPSNQAIFEQVIKSYTDGHSILQTLVNADHKIGDVMKFNSWITGKNSDDEFIVKGEISGKYFTGAFKYHVDEGAHFTINEAVSSSDESVTSIAKGIEDPKAYHTIQIGCLNNWCNFNSTDPEIATTTPENLAMLLLSL